jgi:hypothetical protein
VIEPDPIADPMWVRLIPIIGQAITAIGIAVIGLWRYYKLAEVEIEAMEHKSESGGSGAPIP